MSLPQVAVLAMVQGLTEFLPVSSTAHLYLASWLFGWRSQGLDLDIMLHLGTLLAVIVYFRRDWVEICARAFGPAHFGLLWLLAAASIPVGVAGLAFRRQAERRWRNPFVIGGMLLVVALFMGFAETRGSKARHLAGLGFPDAVAIGIGQALAVVPGTSRSGITIAAGLLRDLDRESAARFSFLLSTPAIAAAAAKALYDRRQSGRPPALPTGVFLAGVAVSAATGFAVLSWFLEYLGHGSLWPLVYYRTIFGIIVVALAFIRRPA
ncbi:MAG: undecaprenyl-diphosphate phosphatase [Bryobacteraceae bacterium]|jgi:undecaprenyl-diphosphatase